jgi:hypothetical protein
MVTYEDIIASARQHALLLRVQGNGVSSFEARVKSNPYITI